MTQVLTGLKLHQEEYYLGLDLRRCKLFVREGPCNVVTDMELLFLVWIAIVIPYWNWERLLMTQVLTGLKLIQEEYYLGLDLPVGRSL